jgi:hypothetical protein
MWLYTFCYISWYCVYDDDDIDPINMKDDEFKRKIIEDVTTNIDGVQLIEVVNVEEDTGPFPKIEHEEIKTNSTNY